MLGRLGLPPEILPHKLPPEGMGQDRIKEDQVGGLQSVNETGPGSSRANYKSGCSIPLSYRALLWGSAALVFHSDEFLACYL